MGEIGDFLEDDFSPRGTMSGDNRLFDDAGHIKHTVLSQSELSLRKIHLRRCFGLTLVQYDEMFERQGGKCLLRGGVNKGSRRLSVDHDHTTGKIRGLLCNCCNLGLGAFRDSPKILQNAIDYLEKHR